MQRIRDLFITSLSHPLLRGSTIVFVGTMLTNVSAYLFQLLVGRILGPQLFAELASLLALFAILNVPSAVLQTILVKYFSSLKAKNENGQSKQLLIMTTKWLAGLEVIILLLVLPLIPYLASFLHIYQHEYFIWLYLIFSTALLGTLNSSVLQAYQKFGESMILTNIVMLLRLFLGVIAAYVGVGMILISNIVANAIAYILSFVPLLSMFRYKSERFIFSKKHILQYSLPTFFTVLGLNSLNNQDIIL